MEFSNQLTKGEIKVIRSLQQKKYRHRYGLFVVEGIRAINEFVKAGANIKRTYVTNPESIALLNININIISAKEFKQISSQQNPQGILAVCAMPQNELNTELISKSTTILVENTQDPGNLGTLIRTADWFGHQQLICSPNCVDCYNPKVIQSSAGALARIKVIYTDLVQLLNTYKSIPSYATTLNGQNLFEIEWKQPCFIILGSEGNGLSNEMIEKAEQLISIPGSGNGESLNLGVAGSIILADVFSKK